MRLLVLALVVLPVALSRADTPRTPPAQSRADIAAVARNPLREPACEILDYGHYVPESRRVRYVDASSVTGERFEIHQIRFDKQTTTIAATLGQRFGIRYRLRGLTQSSVAVTWRVKYPQLVRGSKGWEFSFRSVPSAGELVGHVLYNFDVASEMVTGRWDFSVLVDGQVACSFAFTVK